MGPGNITEDNFLDFAIKSYTNTRCLSLVEFQEDLLHIKYAARLFRKYYLTGDIEPARLRLALNHIIILYNVFRIDAITRLLFFKMEQELYPTLKTFLMHLSYMPAKVYGIDGKNIFSRRIRLDKPLLEKLKAL